ncbi:MAG: TRAP transporter substrate-binding protein [Myxococcota bacterium]|nr:TRAP transporter substrate-binding protein [Myxococcota bacterium]MDP6243733.1 TRAP transporter substrate-binding protein [Myxococcota bacterium]MDP7074986.1 TRAP transporter substrate-binding protein [Myxococcota bacterium]MDP7298214.1 TRAP transporter substrate-binding protein [Myxococcota bacterium]MDP7434430.1 TRAP transporter substrate-binding protein [Myxococcota bacterium]
MPAPIPVRQGAILALALGLACSGSSSERVVHLGHGLDPSHPVHRAMEAMAASVDERSDGALRIEIHPSEQLGSERECLELLQIGSLGMTKVSAAVLEGFAPEFRVFSVPYLFRDDAHRWNALDGSVGGEILLAAEDERLRGLAYYDAGTRNFYTRDRPVRTPSDLRGLKIRTQESPSALALVRAFGAAATPLAWGELYTALQQGVVDGAENNPPSFHLSGHYEVARHYTLNAHTAVPDVLLVSTGLWAQLSERERGWLEAAARESSALQRRLWRDASLAALRAMADAGVEILRPDPRPFASATSGLRAKARADPDLGRLVERIEAAGS